MSILTAILFNSLTLGPLALSNFTTVETRIVQHLPTEGTITSIFGERHHPILGVARHHDGIDIANVRSTTIHATAAGRVKAISREGGYGLMVEIDHGSGWSSRYAHLSQIAVKRGDFVFSGAILGRMGDSGLATAPHLHYELRRQGVPVDPAPYIAICELNHQDLPSISKKQKTPRMLVASGSRQDLK
jgi:murein DD-endopeptidase MepM/ murein hydrolase activator NlpD